MGSDHVYEAKSSGTKWKPEELSAEVLKSLKGDVQRKTGEVVEAAVITVPAAFKLHQCNATKKAAQLAGFKESPLLLEPTAAALADLKEIQGLLGMLSPLDVKPSDAAPQVVAAAEFLLEGLVAHRKLSRSEERGFAAQDKTGRKQERQDLEIEFDDWQRARRTGRGGLN